MSKTTRFRFKALTRRLLSMLLVLVLGFATASGALAAGGTKNTVSRSIAIVFDNSGSMYMQGNKAWCRATYAIEVFASMMNVGDVLRVYPMYPVTSQGQDYSSLNPVSVSGGGDISVIRDIYTPHAGDTPIETIGDAYASLQQSTADEKWLIVLTDGDEFYENNEGLGYATSTRLSQVLTGCTQEANVLYLGIGTVAVMPQVSAPEGRLYYADQAVSSSDVLSKLTDMCNMIFGRDKLAEAGSTFSFDVSMKKLILFVQGSGISGVTLKDSSGASVGAPSLEYSPRYSEQGAGSGLGYSTFGVDTSLSGYIAIYDTGLDAGSYTLGYSGDVSNVSIYYEPDVDLVANLTDENGGTVSASSELYPGTYYINYGLADRDGNLTTSPLLGSTSYKVTYSINGEEKTAASDQSGRIALELQEGDVLDGRISVTYLSGYSITKDSSQLGWPQGGFHISARPVGALELRVSGGASSYPLSQLEEFPYNVQLLYNGTPLTGQALERATLSAVLEGGNAGCTAVPGDDGYTVALNYAGSAAETACGTYTLRLQASYTDEYGVTAQSQENVLSFAVEDDGLPLSMEIEGSGYYVISDLAEDEPLRAVLSLGGAPLTDQQLDAACVTVEGDGLSFQIEPLYGQSAYAVRIVGGGAAVPGKYNLRFHAVSSDQIGREITADAAKKVELSTYPLWLRFLVFFLVLFLIVALILFYLSRKILPKKIALNSAQTLFTVNGDVVQGLAKCTFTGSGKKQGSLLVNTPPYSGSPLVKGGFTLRLQAVSPRRLKSARRRALVTQVIPVNAAALTSLSIGTHTMTRSEESGEVFWTFDGKPIPGPSAPAKFEIGGKPSCVFVGETITGDSFTLTVQLQFK